MCRDPQLEEDVLNRLNMRKKKRCREEEEKLPTDAFFDEKLACFNGIKSCNLSMGSWDRLRLFLKDYHSRGGDLHLPSSATLRTYRECMVPRGLLTSTTTARIPLQSVLNHTAERIMQ